MASHCVGQFFPAKSAMPAMPAMPAIIPRIAVLVEPSSCTALLVRWIVQQLTYHSAHPEKTAGIHFV